MEIINWQTLSAEQQAAVLARPFQQQDTRRRQQVAAIIEKVRSDGDSAVQAFTRQFDGVNRVQMQVPAGEGQAALQALPLPVRQALEQASGRIRAFHEAQLPQPVQVTTATGVSCETLYRPIQRVGLYVPAGSAPLPSTVMMLAIPAALAKCPQRVLVTPPRADGSADPVVLATAALCGIDSVFVVGGAQAIAALAYGTESVPKVDKIFGPGNAWVTEAKQQVAADPQAAAIDMPAGPSEVLIVADGSVPARFTALDLLSQAEHGPDSQAILVADNDATLQAVKAELARQQRRLGRQSIVRQSLRHARLIRVADRATLQAVSNAYAPEHLIVQVENPRQFLTGITAAGSVFLGPWTPESLGDYCSGTNHVLPTYGHARSHSGLSVTDFMNRITVQQASSAGLQAIGPDAEILAQLEGLDGHRLAVTERLEQRQNHARNTTESRLAEEFE